MKTILAFLIIRNNRGMGSKDEKWERKAHNFISDFILTR